MKDTEQFIPMRLNANWNVPTSRFITGTFIFFMKAYDYKNDVKYIFLSTEICMN